MEERNNKIFDTYKWKDNIKDDMEYHTFMSGLKENIDYDYNGDLQYFQIHLNANEKGIDENSYQAKYAFLANHPTHYEHPGRRKYSRGVKLHDLGLDDEQEKVFWEFTESPEMEIFWGINEKLADGISQEGRMGGHLVLDDEIADPADLDLTYYKTYDAYIDGLEGYELEDANELIDKHYAAVKDFDERVDKLIDLFKQTLTKYAQYQGTVDESINIHEQLNQIDLESYNEYDLLNLYESSNLAVDNKKKLAEMLKANKSAQEIHGFLSTLVEGYSDLLQEKVEEEIKFIVLEIKRDETLDYKFIDIFSADSKYGDIVEYILQSTPEELEAEGYLGAAELSRNSDLDNRFFADDVFITKGNDAAFKEALQEYYDNVLNESLNESSASDAEAKDDELFVYQWYWGWPDKDLDFFYKETTEEERAQAHAYFKKKGMSYRDKFHYFESLKEEYIDVRRLDALVDDALAEAGDLNFDDKGYDHERLEKIIDNLMFNNDLYDYEDYVRSRVEKRYQYYVTHKLKEDLDDAPWIKHTAEISYYHSYNPDDWHDKEPETKTHFKFTATMIADDGEEYQETEILPEEMTDEEVAKYFEDNYEGKVKSVECGEEVQVPIDEGCKKKSNRKCSLKEAAHFNLGSNKTLSPAFNPEHKQAFDNLEYVRTKLEETSPNGHKYKIINTYEDYGAGMKWTTILDTAKDVQVLSPRDWLDIANATSTAELDKVIAEMKTDKYWQDKLKATEALKEDVKTTTVSSIEDALDGADGLSDEAFVTRINFSVSDDTYIEIAKEDAGDSGRPDYYVAFEIDGEELLAFSDRRYNSLEAVKKAISRAYYRRAFKLECLTEGAMKEIDIEIQEVGDKEAWLKNTVAELKKLKDQIKFLEEQAPKEINKGGAYDSPEDLKQALQQTQKNYYTLRNKYKIVAKLSDEE